MKLENVEKTYGDRVALAGIDLEIGEGELLAVLGESGAGKTTLLNVLAGLTSYGGTIDGQTGKKPVRRKRCAYLFQDPVLLPHLTAEGNLRFALPKSEWGRIGGMLERVGLGGREKARPFELSGGEKQRVAIARAFLYPHDLLLMDEPFSSLDLALKASLIGLVGELSAETGGTVVFVTHDVREAAALSRRAVVLKKGRIVLDFKVEEPFPRDFFRPQPAEEALVRALVGEG